MPAGIEGLLEKAQRDEESSASRSDASAWTGDGHSTPISLKGPSSFVPKKMSHCIEKLTVSLILRSFGRIVWSTSSSSRQTASRLTVFCSLVGSKYASPLPWASLKFHCIFPWSKVWEVSRPKLCLTPPKPCDEKRFGRGQRNVGQTSNHRLGGVRPQTLDPGPSTLNSDTRNLNPKPWVLSGWHLPTPFSTRMFAIICSSSPQTCSTKSPTPLRQSPIHGHASLRQRAVPPYLPATPARSVNSSTPTPYWSWAWPPPCTSPDRQSSPPPGLSTSMNFLSSFVI